MGCTGQQYAMDLVRDGIRVSQYVVIPEAQDEEAVFPQESISLQIPGLVRVLTTIDFDNELALHADEIEDVVVVGMLPSKLAPIELTLAQDVPHPALGVRRVVAQLPLQFLVENRFVGLPTHRMLR